ncbi:hypothetical protein V8F06_013613 [Rhypophila decipiens]
MRVVASVTYHGSVPKRAFDWARSQGVSRRRLASFDAMAGAVTDIASCLRLDTEPISALSLFQVSGEGFGVFCVHHLCIDIVSWQILSDDLSRLLRGEGIVVPELGTFRDWALRL